MKNPNKSIKVILIIIFALISVGSMLSAIYWIWLSAFGIGWGGGETTWIELIWMWKELILISIFSFIASFGLIKNKKFGIIFGYTVPIGFLVFLFYDYNVYGWNQEKPFTLSDLFWSVVYLGTPILIFIGLSQIKKELNRNENRNKKGKLK